MSWTDHYRRQEALDAVVDHARRDPSGPLPYADVPDVPELFDSPHAVLLALHHRWLLRLSGRLAVAEADAARDDTIDPVEAVSAAYRATAAANPALLDVLDRHPGGLGEARAREHRALAVAAGLAGAHEPADEVARIGAALTALIRTTPPRPDRCRTQTLWRRLVASA